MISHMISKMKYFHLKLIHEHPKGIYNRFQNNADKWVESLRHQNIKTYYDFFQNNETKAHNIKIHLTQKEQTYSRQVQSAVKPSISDLNQWATLNFPTRPDDNQLSRDISGMTITKFIKEGRQNLTDLHKLILTGALFIVVHTALYFIFYHGKQLPKNERVKVLNAEILESYHLTYQQMIYTKIKQRIKMVNQEYQAQLKQSKILL